MLFESYLAENGRVPSVEEINSKEKFYLPATLNPYLCRYIQFGKYSLAKVVADQQNHLSIMQ